MGDWDGNGTDTPGVVRGNVWYLNNGFDADYDYPSFGFGSAGDRVVVGDWDGNGTETPGVVKDVQGQKKWFLTNNRDSDSGDAGEVNGVVYGSPDPDPNFEEPTDHFPITGNWNASPPGINAFDTWAVVIGNAWHLKNTFSSNGQADAVSGYGVALDTPLAIDRSPTLEVDTQSVVRGELAC